MVNIVAGREVCPEFIQGAATAAALADAVEPLLGDTPERRRMLQGLEEINRRLGPGQAAERAAAVVLDELGRGPSQMSA
jgi:lipid-A-disaccharide synthase